MKHPHKYMFMHLPWDARLMIAQRHGRGRIGVGFDYCDGSDLLTLGTFRTWAEAKVFAECIHDEIWARISERADNVRVH